MSARRLRRGLLAPVEGKGMPPRAARLQGRLDCLCGLRPRWDWGGSAERQARVTAYYDGACTVTAEVCMSMGEPANDCDQPRFLGATDSRRLA